MRKQRTKLLERATVIRKVKNLEHTEFTSARNILVRKHLGLTEKNSRRVQGRKLVHHVNRDEVARISSGRDRQTNYSQLEEEHNIK